MSTTGTAWRDTTGWRLVLDHVVAGAEGSVGELGSPDGITLFADGRVVVSDQSPTTLKLYDATGKFVRTIGREGAGPSEYRSPMLAANNRWIIVHDYQLARANIYRPDGTLVRSFASSCCSGGLAPFIDAKGRISTPAFHSGGSSAANWWVRFDSLGRRLDSMPFPAPMKPAVWTVSMNGGTARYNIPFAPVNVNRMLSDGRVIHGRTDRYEFVVSRTGADTALLFGRSGVAAVPVPKAIRDSVFADKVRRSPQLKASASVGDLPGTYDLWNQVHEDGQGNFWVQRGRQASGAQQFDVFAASGAFLGSVPRPWSPAVTAWAGDRVAVLDTDADDLPRVRVYKIVRK
jgi:hypothetical protein